MDESFIGNSHLNNFRVLIEAFYKLYPNQLRDIMKMTKNISYAGRVLKPKKIFFHFSFNSKFLGSIALKYDKEEKKVVRVL